MTKNKINRSDKKDAENKPDKSQAHRGANHSLEPQRRESSSLEPQPRESGSRKHSNLARKMPPFPTLQKPTFQWVRITAPSNTTSPQSDGIGVNQFHGAADVLKPLEVRLNRAKDQLDSLYDPTRSAAHRNAFGTVSMLLDAYSSLRKILREKFRGQCVSNSWMKYYEIFMTFDLAVRHHHPHVFFNAELPGGSLSAWNHYMQTRPRGVGSGESRESDSAAQIRLEGASATHIRLEGASAAPYTWNAASGLGDPNNLNNNDNKALDDRHQLYAMNRDAWLMDETWRGDAKNPAQIARWEEMLSEKVDLYSHDAGEDARKDYNNQERINSQLHIGCALVGLLCMKPGATFIAKQYTCFLPVTQSLISGLAELFDEFHLVKPKSSRPRNSEMYLVGLGYRGKKSAEPFIAALRARLGNESAEALGPISPEALVAMRLFLESMIDAQIKSLNELVIYDQFLPKDDKRAIAEMVAAIGHHCNSQHNKVQRQWISQYNVQRLPAAGRLKCNE